MNRNKVLDTFRFLAVFLVMMTHCTVSSGGIKFLDVFTIGLHNIGAIGVDIFFVLSGFLVSGLIFREYQTHQSFKATKFLIRRGFKIYPVYLFYILMITGYEFAKYHQINTGKLLSELFFYINYTPYIFIASGLLWTICVEEHFYFLLAILLLLLIKSKQLTGKNILYIYLFFLSISMVFKTINYLHYDDFVLLRDNIKSHQRFDALFFGVLLGYVYINNAELSKKLYNYRISILLGCILVLILGGVIHFTSSHEKTIGSYLLNIVYPNLYPICFGLPMLVMVQSTRLNNATWIRPLAYIGMYSYPIYLFHSWVNALHNYLHINAYLYVLIYLIISITVGIFLSKMIEYPMLRLRDKLYPSNAL